MHETSLKADIYRVLNRFTARELAESATQLLNILGYESQRTLNRDANTTEAFLEDFDADNLINPEKALLHEWHTADFLFQLTADEIRQHMQETLTFNEDPGVDKSIYQSYLFLAIKLKGDTYSRTALANITREINKLFAMPAMLIFQHGHALTFAIINRRPSQRDRDLDVLEKVVLIKDIDVVNPHRAHLDILGDLSLDALYHGYEFSNFLELHQAWQKTLDTSELNRRFFQEIADWYFWAVSQVTFPLDKGDRGVDSKLRHLLAYNDEPHQFTDTETEHLITAIDTLKILDPACGSGAFPMGILHKLVFLLSKLDPRNAQWRQRQIDRVQGAITASEKIDDSTFRESAIKELEREIESINEAFERNALDYGRKLYLIENCIYGVDIQPIATQIAKLRFFISLIVEQKIDDIRENRGVRPLPNLETKFVAANTLLGVEKPAQMSLRNPEVDTKEQALAEVRRRHFTARTPRTKERYRKQDANLRSEISTILQRDGFPSETTEKIAHWDPYNQNTSADFFDPEWMFGITDGFDVVIGNPPYISHDKISKQLKAKIKNGYQSYQPFADIYCYFIEKAIDLQNEGGILSFITSNSYLRAEYGAPIRNLLQSKNILLRMLNIEDSQVFESAIVNVSIIVSHKPTNSSDDFCIVVNSPFSGGSFEDFVRANGFNYPQVYFGSKSWNLAEPKLVELQKKLESSGKTLEELNTKIRLGIATGSNEAFLIDEDQRREFCEKNPINTKIIKPILRGRDISRYSYTLPEQYVLLTKNGVNVERDYPDIYEHLDSFGDKFKNRGAQGQHWTNLRACSFYDDFKKGKIVWIELSDLGRFALCNDEVYLLNSAYFLLSPSGMDSKFLLGILNSSTICFYLSLVAETSGMGTSRWINNYVKEFPIPAVTYQQQTRIIKIVNQILEAKIANPDADTANLEQEIDKCVYALYNLTQEEIAIVKEAI
ncbi:MAG: Eco57I restriction-modification methylase domain-containing protein [Candidatus Poribacteria bacterium]|nr:Eco57I restriction-modification methylase domain-containing protein [Candidatus Poribacteria bacterium]